MKMYKQPGNTAGLLDTAEPGSGSGVTSFASVSAGEQSCRSRKLWLLVFHVLPTFPFRHEKVVGFFLFG